MNLAPDPRLIRPARPDPAGKKPLHVLLTVNSAWNAVNFRQGLIAGLLARGHRVSVLAPEDDHAGRLAAMGCRFIALRMDSKGLSPVADALLWRRMAAHFRAARPDVVLGFTIKPNIYGALAAERLGIPFLPNITGLGTAFMGRGWLGPLAQRLYRRAFARVPAVFFQNPEDAQFFTECGMVRAGQPRLLPGSGIDLDRFRPAPLRADDGEIRFLMIARLLRDKGVVEFAEAARALRASHPQARCQLLGPLGVANRGAIDAPTLAGWTAEGIIDHLGDTADVRPFIAGADCVVLPSYREGTPRTLLEAGAMTRPVVATDVPGCRDVVEPEATGLLCRARDGADLARALRRMIGFGRPERRLMGVLGRQRIEKIYDQSHVVAAYLREIDRLGTVTTGADGIMPSRYAGSGRGPV